MHVMYSNTRTSISLYQSPRHLLLHSLYLTNIYHCSEKTITSRCQLVIYYSQTWRHTHCRHIFINTTWITAIYCRIAVIVIGHGTVVDVLNIWNNSTIQCMMVCVPGCCTDRLVMRTDVVNYHGTDCDEWQHVADWSQTDSGKCYNVL